MVRIYVFVSSIVFFAFFACFVEAQEMREISNMSASNVVVRGVISTKIPELLDLGKVDINRYVLVNRFENIKVVPKGDVNVITFEGSISALHQDKKLKCDSLTIFVVDNEVEEIVGEGNVKFVDGEDLFEGEKFFYNLRSGKISLYGARTKLGDQYYYAGVMKQLSPTKFFFEDVTFTKSDLLFPTYRVNAYRVWHYREDYMISLNNSYWVGVGSFLYFPTYFELYRYTDIFTDIGLESTVGFYVQNTFYPRNWFGEKIFPRAKVKFDHYERLGEYVGFEFPNINLISNLVISAIVDFEYDKKYEPMGNYIVNYIDQYGRGEYREYRTFGWYYNIKASYTVAGTSVNFSAEDLSDPFLPAKFSSRREKFDVRKFVFPYENKFWSLPGPRQSVSRNLRVNYQYGVSSFSLGLDWVYQLRSGYSTTNTNAFDVVIIENKTNRYANDYYRYDIQRFSGPNISYSANLGNVLSLSYQEVKTNFLTNVVQPTMASRYLTNERVLNKTFFEMDLFVVVTNLITNVTTNTNVEPFGVKGLGYRVVTNVIERVVTNLSVSTNLISRTPLLREGEKKVSISTNVTSTRWFTLNVSPSVSVSLTPSSVYRIEDGSPLEDTFSHKENVNVSTSIAFLDNLLGINSSLSIQNTSIWTKTDNPIRRKQDDLSSVATLNLGNSMSVGGCIFGKTVFSSEPKLSVFHNISYRLTKPKLLSADEDPYIDDITSHGVGASLNLRILDLTLLSNSLLNFLGFSSIFISTGLSYNLVYLKSEMKYREDKHYWTNKISNPVGVSVSFGPWLSLGVSYRIKVSNESTVFDPVIFSFGGSISLREIPIRFLIDKITYLNINYNFHFDYVNPINNRFTLGLSVGGMIDEYWSFVISTSVVNTKIYRYVAEYARRYNVPQVDLARDLLDAINIFDINALRRTLFKNPGMNVSLSRDLYDWTASLSGGIRLYKDEVKNFAFFEPFLEFKIVSKKGIGFEVPPIQPELYRLFEN